MAHPVHGMLEQEARSGASVTGDMHLTGRYGSSVINGDGITIYNNEANHDGLYFGSSGAFYYIMSDAASGPLDLYIQAWRFTQAGTMNPSTTNVYDIGTAAKVVRNIFTAAVNWLTRAAPASPVNGDMWFDGTALKIQIGGATKTVTVT